MKLNRIEIEKFRTIENLSLTIDKLLVLIGENNSGKSNILRALQLFYQESVRGIDEECFFFKECSIPISIILTFNRLDEAEEEHRVLQHWIYNGEIKVKKVIQQEVDSDKYAMQFFGWQAKPVEGHFDLDNFDEYKSDIKKIVEENELPDYFKTETGTITQASYKNGVKEHIENGLVELGEPGWRPNPGGYKEVFASLLPRFYLVPAVKDAQEESKTTQQTVFGKLINDLTNKIISKNPKFEDVKQQIDGLKKYLNRSSGGNDLNRLQEIKDLESTISDMISENMPDTTVEIEIVTPELVDLFKDTIIKINDSIPTSIDSKGHGLQRALVFAYIRAYAKFLNTLEGVEDGEASIKNFILAIEEPELYLHPNGQRKMVDVLTGISQTDQVILSTHSNFFVNMHNYNNLAIVKRENNGPTDAIQYVGDIFEAEDEKSKTRLRKVFRSLSLFDLSRSEMFFAKKVILVEGDTEKFMIPFCASALSELDKKYDFAANNISIAECGGKNNIHIFMRVLNRFEIPYVVVHDVDPIGFPEDKPDKTGKEKQEHKTFKENEFIVCTLNPDIGKIIRVNPELEGISGVSKSQAEKYGKVQATYMRYDDMDVKDYPQLLKDMIDLLVIWDKAEPIFEISEH
ncbi:MAG: AAA family ATPase [Thermotogaceae bacterium]|nr:AAA family ATPase [Thermotogaceae bacterium]